MQATGLILLLAAGVIVLSQSGSFVPLTDPAEHRLEYKVIAKEISGIDV